MNNTPLVDITPDVRLLRVLRNSGFNLQTAMGEILDNCLDAGASQIDVSVFFNNLNKKNIMVVDNGKGMNINTLQYSLTLAKELKVGIDQLGKYGMGMKTASLSLSTSFVIFTKTVSGNVLYGEFNINKMENAGEFKTTVREATEEEKTFFHEKVGKKSRSGTIIIIQNCDRFDISFSTFIRQMTSFIGLTYKHSIQRGIVFTLSDESNEKTPVEAIDPLMRDHKGTYLFADREVFPIEYEESNGKKKSSVIEVSVALLPMADDNSKGKTVNGKAVPIAMNQSTQGVYVYREGRLVGQALTWTDVTKERHNQNNRHRIEIHCKSELDDEIRMNHQKGNVSPTGALKHQLSLILNPFIQDMTKRDNKEKDEKIEEKKEKRKVLFKKFKSDVSKTTAEVEKETKEENENKRENKQHDKQECTPSAPVQPDKDTKTEETDTTYLSWINMAKQLGEFLRKEDVPTVIKDLILSHIQPK